MLELKWCTLFLISSTMFVKTLVLNKICTIFKPTVHINHPPAFLSVCIHTHTHAHKQSTYSDTSWWNKVSNSISISVSLSWESQQKDKPLYKERTKWLDDRPPQTEPVMPMQGSDTAFFTSAFREREEEEINKIIQEVKGGERKQGRWGGWALRWQSCSCWQSVAQNHIQGTYIHTYYAYRQRPAWKKQE